ncbi:hypothetical protein TgHK011_001190 [Trichoderma gracile]|nr:hypothetical protein TgHK011_001190 [Trichoderma gracile]
MIQPLIARLFWSGAMTCSISPNMFVSYWPKQQRSSLRGLFLSDARWDEIPLRLLASPSACALSLVRVISCGLSYKCKDLHTGLRAPRAHTHTHTRAESLNQMLIPARKKRGSSVAARDPFRWTAPPERPPFSKPYNTSRRRLYLSANCAYEYRREPYPKVEVAAI